MIYCAAPEDISDTIKKAVENIKPEVKGDINNTFSINNSKFNVDSIVKGVQSIGAAGVAAAGVTGGAKLIYKAPVHPIAKLAFVGAGGLIGGAVGMLTVAGSSMIQRSMDNSNKPGSNSGTSGGDAGGFTNFPSIEFNNDLDIVMMFLNGNFIIHVCISIVI